MIFFYRDYIREGELYSTFFALRHEAARGSSVRNEPVECDDNAKSKVG